MKQEIGIYYWARVGVMICSLLGVLYIMNHLNLGHDTSPSSVTLCPTRVSSVAVIGKAALMQDGLQWYRTQDGQREELDPVAVEKWFSQYCTIAAEPASKPESAQPWITWAYVSGSPKTVQQATDGVYVFEGRAFRAPALMQAVQDLENLPKVTKPGQN